MALPKPCEECGKRIVYRGRYTRYCRDCLEKRKQKRIKLQRKIKRALRVSE